MIAFLYILLAILVVLAAWFLVSLFWGKPWSIDLFYARTFLKMALENPEMLTMLGILEKFGIHLHNARLSDASLKHETKLYDEMRRGLKTLRSYARQRQTRSKLLSTDVMDWFLDDQLRGEV